VLAGGRILARFIEPVKPGVHERLVVSSWSRVCVRHRLHELKFFAELGRDTQRVVAAYRQTQRVFVPSLKLSVSEDSSEITCQGDFSEDHGFTTSPVICH
jgi:hypothetical protein